MVAEVGSLSVRTKMTIKIFVKCIYYFCEKYIVVACNCKFSNLMICMICKLPHVWVHFLPKKHCFAKRFPKNSVFAKKFQKVPKLWQILLLRQKSVCFGLKLSVKALCVFSHLGNNFLGLSDNLFVRDSLTIF